MQIFGRNLFSKNEISLKSIRRNKSFGVPLWHEKKERLIKEKNQKKINKRKKAFAMPCLYISTVAKQRRL